MILGKEWRSLVQSHSRFGTNTKTNYGRPPPDEHRICKSKAELPNMTLISTSILKMIRRSFRLGEPLGCHPYEWDEGRNLPCWTRSKLKLASWGLNLLLTLVHFGFVLLRTIQVNMERYDGKGVNIMLKIYMQFMLICFTFPLLFQLTFLTQRGKLVRYIEGFFKLCRYFEG